MSDLKNNIPPEFLADLQEIQKLKETDPTEYAKRLSAFNESLKDLNKKMNSLLDSVS